MKNMNKLVALLLAAVMVLGLMPTMTVHAHAHTAELHGIEEYPVLTVDTEASAVIANAGEMAYFTFTPETTDLYFFYSMGAQDTKGFIYDADMKQINFNDDANYGNAAGASSPNFCMEQVMEAGVTYVLAAQAYNRSWTGEFPVIVKTGHQYTSEVTKEATCSEDGIMTYTCSYCGSSYDEAIPAAHRYSEVDGKCVFCGEAYLITGTCGENLTWELDYFGKLTVSGTGAMDDYVISWDSNNPAPWYDEYRNAITSVVVEEGVTYIGSYAFYYCGESLTSVKLAQSVEAMGHHAFASCYSLSAIALPDGLTEIPDSCFASCGSLSSVQWPASLTTLGANAFYQCDLGDLTLPEGITTIGGYALGSNSNMTKLILPSTLNELADQAFSSMYNLENIVFTGDAFEIPANTFYYTTANVWYPADNATWTEDVRQNYGGTLTWKPICTGSHAYGAAVTVPATCEVGEYMTMTCTACGWVTKSPEGEPLGHDYVTEPYNGGCNSYSYDITTCTRCNYYSTTNLVWVDHFYETTHVDATCDVGGYDLSICTECGYRYESNYTAPLGHDVAEWSEPTEATCTEPGVKTGDCARCGETVSEKVADALGHEWDEENGVANGDGSTTYTCIRCGDTYRTEGSTLFLGDNQFTIDGSTGGKTKTFTAEEAGKLTITMKDMGWHNAWAWENGWTDQYWQTLGIKWVFDEGYFNVYVNDVNTTYTGNGDHEIILPTIDVNAGDVIEVEVNHLESSGYFANDIQFNMNLTLAPNHTHSYTAVVTEPTCTEGGYTTYTCECGDSYTADETPALGHTEAEAVRENEKAATCTEAGSYESVVYCSVCGEEVSRETVTVEATGHTEEVIPAVEATCTETGLTEGKKCSVCGEILVAQEVVDALGHEYESVVTEPTCTEQGYTTHTCAACGDSYVDSYTDALGHEWKGTGCSRCDAKRVNPFTDVPEDSFYIDPVLWAVEEGITNGTSETTFDPDGDCMRAAVVTFLWRAAGEPEPTITENPFTDVEETDFFYKAVLWAVEKGITNGTSADKFSPYENCNRAQVVTFLYRAMEKPAYSSTESGFTDVTDPDEFYYDAVLWAVENNITNGMGDGTFGISKTCNRAQVVTFLYRTYVG